MTAELDQMRSILDEAFVDFDPDATDVLDVEVIAEQVTFTPGPGLAEVLARPAPVADAAVRWVPPVGWVPVPPDEATPIFDQVEAGWRWRTPAGRASPKRRTWAAYVAECRADTAAVTAAVGTYYRGRR